MKDLKIEEYFAIGFDSGKNNYWEILGNFLLTLLVIVVISFTIIGILFIPAFLAGFTKYLLNTVRGVKASISDCWKFGFENGMWWKSLLLVLIMSIGIVVGLMLLIIPGLYLATVWILAMFLLVDRNMLPTDALGSSRELVHELGFWKVFGVYMLTNIVIQILSVIPILNIVAIFTIPFMYTIYLAVYENTIKDSLTT
jgi:hypothetical protein